MGTTAPEIVDSLEAAIEPWVYAGISGRSIRTTNYRIHTTSPNQALVRILPALYESANRAYRGALGTRSTKRFRAAAESQAEREDRMDVYLFGTRGEWEKFSRDLLGSRADQYMLIKRGGFSTRGSSIIYDLGLPDTIRIAAHEGWHQFVQATFAEPLPVWLDEGMATRMEAMIPVENGSAFEAVPWSNTSRLRRLREIRRTNRLVSLTDLVSANPGTLLLESDDAVLDYYAQVWAFTLFLEEYDHERYAARFRLLLCDARDHRLWDRIRTSADENANVNRRVPKEDITPDLALRTYFNPNLEAIQNEWIEFVEIICSEGAEPVAARGQWPYRFPSGGIH